MIKNLLFTVCSLSLLLFSCNSEKNRPIPIKMERFDKAIFTNNLSELVEKYPDFAPFYLEKIIEVGSPTDSATQKYFQKFQDTYQKDVYDSVKITFKNIQKIEAELGKALGNYKAIFPHDSLPKFYTHFSGFNTSIISTKTIISVSIENYLGNSSFYDKLGIFHYLRKKMYPEKIPIDIVKRLLFYKITSKNAFNNLRNAMIYEGKMLYALQQIFPNRSVEFFLNYSEEQTLWCKENEPMMWQFIIEQKHLFSSNYKIIRRYIDEAPFTKGFPNNSPGQTGSWIGYQIVKKYAKNTQTPLRTLLDETNYEKILKESTYNPEF